MQRSITDFVSEQPKLSESWESKGAHSSSGKGQEDCHISDKAGRGIGCSTSTPSAILQDSMDKKDCPHTKTADHVLKKPRKLRPSTPASQQGSSLSTLKHKSKTSKTSIPLPSCSEIARLDSTSVAKGCYRFYNESLKGVYESCILPTETDFAASHTISSSTYSSTTVQLSQWRQTIHCPQRVSLPKTCSLSSPFSAHACTVVEAVLPEESDEEEEDSIVTVGKKRKRTKGETSSKRIPFKRKDPMKGRPRCYKIRMLPTKSQVVELKRCFGAAREAYNFANKRVRDDKMPASVISLKKDWVRVEKTKELQDRLSGVASRIMNRAIKDLAQAYRSNFAKMKKNPSHKFEVKDRCEHKTRTECIHIENQKALLEVINVKSSSENKRRAECKLRFGNNLGKHGPVRIQGKDKLIAKVVATGINLQADAMIQWDKGLNAFYFIWVEDVPVKPDPDKAFENKRIVSLDPGSAPFQQWYSPTSGKFGELLVGAREGLKKQCLCIDKLHRRINNRKKCSVDNYTTKRQKRFPKRKQRHKRNITARYLRKKLRRECKRLSGRMHSAHYEDRKSVV